MKKAIPDLLKERDFILLLGKAVFSEYLQHDNATTRGTYAQLYSPPVRRLGIHPIDDDLRSMLTLVGNLAQELEADVRGLFPPAWFQVFDGLLALKLAAEPRRSEAIKVWRSFGQTLKVNEDRERMRYATLRSDEMGGLVGCSWLRCPLNGCRIVQEVLRCSGCKAVRTLRL